MEKMLDWWTIPGGTWGIGNFNFKVELTEDENPGPLDFDQYTERDEELLNSGDWGFVTVHVTPVGDDLTDHVCARRSISGIEWGRLADTVIDRPDLLEHPIKGLVEEALVELLRLSFHVAINEGSDVSVEKLLAPAPF